MDHLEVGEWLNVVGYIRKEPRPVRVDKVSTKPQKTTVVKVQALIVWSAGSLKIDAYEQAAIAKTKQDHRMLG